ncbi:hypothetical protein C0992_012003 [Termitomyces sp. T32_za158]|nr:hypothetical protein C0992_012003 [Termitomyces sp. T32_za158]
MSEGKRKRGLQEIHDEIKGLLLTTKPQLDDPKPSTRPSLTSDLYQVASLAESFLEQRPRSNKKSWIQLADSLDQEGVNLWNISGLIRKTPENDGRILVGALRLAAFRLIESGVEAKPGIESLLHILQLASKTGATLSGMAVNTLYLHPFIMTLLPSEVGRHDVAARVLTSAAKYEELLRNTDDPDGVHQAAIACGTVVYFSSRMEAAWQEKNYTVADFMSQKITDDDQRITLLPLHSRQLLASKFHRIGKSMLELPEGTKPSDAVVWLQKAFTLADPLEDNTVPGVAELKASSGYRELRWLRLATLKRRKAGDAALLDAFKSIIDHMDYSEANITE